MVKLKFAVVFKAVASVAVMLKVSVPFVVGVPEINHQRWKAKSPGRQRSGGEREGVRRSSADLP